MSTDQASAPVDETAAATALPNSGLWPLIGRDAELDAVRRALVAGKAGVVLAGEPGLGKTRLAREAVRQAEHRDLVSYWLTTSKAGRRIQLGAFAHMITPSKTPSEELDLPAKLSRALRTRARGRKLVLGIDDANYLDETSAALIGQLAVSGQVFVIATVRSGGPVPDVITALWKEGHATRLEVTALSRPHVTELIAAALGGPVTVPTSQLLWDATQGNVLFLREVINAGLESGALTCTSSRIWSWQGPLTISARLVDTVECSLGKLDEQETAILEVLAQGEPLEAALLESLFPTTALHAIERRGLLRSHRDGNRLMLRLAYPLHGHVLRARTPELRTREIRKGLGNQLAGTGARRRTDALRIAAFRVDCGGNEQLEHLLNATREALATFHHPLAERTARAAREAGGGAVAVVALAHALYLQGRHDDALRELDSLAGETLAERERAVSAALRAQILCWGIGRLDDAKLVLEQAIDEVTAPSLTDLLRSVHAAVLLLSGRPDAAARGALMVLGNAGEYAETDDSDHATVPAAMVAHFALAARGSSTGLPREATKWTEKLDRLDGCATLPPGTLLAAQTHALRASGRLTEAAKQCEDNYRAALVRGDRQSAVPWVAVLGRVMLDRGQVSQARRWLAEALTLSTECLHVTTLPACLAWLAEADALLGEVSEATYSLRRAQEVTTPATALFRPDLAIAHSWIAAAQGDVQEAKTLALNVATEAERTENLGIAVSAMHTVVRFGGAEAARGHLHRLATVVDTPLARLYAAHADALCTKDGAELDTMSRSFAASGATLLAAEAAAEAAASHSAKGELGRSRSSAATARALLAGAGRVRSPALVGLKAPALTMRERQVALLAAQGLASRTIAQRLALSVRTVDNHLQMVYGKLGIKGRRALTAALDAFSG